MISPGIYDFSIEDYHASMGLSRSGIMLLKRSELHFWEKYMNPDRVPEKQSKALEFGAAFHPYILEPELFALNFAVEDENVDGRTAAGKLYRKKFQEENADKIIIKKRDYDQIVGMAKAINRDNDAKELILGAEYEKSIYWVDPATEILCKCRPDILHINMINDLKTAANASVNAFRWAVRDYGYHIQAAMMREASRHILEKDIENFIFIVIEKDPPYAIGIHQLDEATLNKGREEFMIELLKYKKCIDENRWQGYGVNLISLPA